LAAELVSKFHRSIKAGSNETLSWLFLCSIFAALLGTTQTIQATSFQLWASSTTLRSPAGVGNMLTTKKPIGTWTYTFDNADRLKTVLTPELHETSYEYDQNGNRTSAKNANLNAMTMAYNERNTLKSGDSDPSRYGILEQVGTGF